MKKSLILGILGLAAGVASSYGQGQITLDTYQTSQDPVKFGGVNVNNTFTAGLFYVPTANLNAVSSVLADAAGTALPTDLYSGFTLATGAGSTSAFFQNTGFFSATAGFLIQPVQGTGLNSYTLMVVAYNGSSYANSTIRGHSAAFYEQAGAVATSGSGGVAGPMGPFSVFSVAPVPEPTTLALAGLGGFGMLMALRRKQA